jgi:adenylylsulfate kinase-like enzyme
MMTVPRKILIMGLPGAGKTTLADALAPLLNAVVFNADAVRANLSRDLGFSHDDRVEHARRMGWMCDRVVEAGGTVVADFICPTPQTRAAFGEAFTIWVDRIEAACSGCCPASRSRSIRTTTATPIWCTTNG